MRKQWKGYLRACLGVLLAFCALNVAGCTMPDPPQRNGIFKTWPEAVRSYKDYLSLERAGVETLNLKMGRTILTVSLPFYLFTIAQEFERLGKRPQAVQLYLRLLTHYPLLDDENQLGVRIENRLHWLLSDKTWIRPSAGELIAALEKALRTEDVPALKYLISRDFGFGEDPAERIVVNYQWALEFMRSQMPRRKTLAFSVLPQENGKVWLQVKGWGGTHPVWILVLRHRERAPEGWEWDTVLWGE